ncbi:site-specific integrase [uncultured Desulfovibrio sp.]|uniref:tyrosine-type recombinase/integrase n=1 Tax=uncultured Desulfovibrio sp. TaxID=167968 RepID=UPI002670777B|nr:site-specific integrase [uncultured Desulfovibrio sp.]
MAVSKYQTKNGPRWIADVYQDGVRIGRKAGFRSRREALAWEEEQKSLRTQPEDLGLRDVCTAHLLYCESRLKPNTISYKKTAYRRFIEYAGAMTPFRKIDKATIDGFVEAAAKMISKKTANKYKTELSSLWAWAGKEGYVTGNPPRQIDAYAVKKAVKYVPPAADIKSLLTVAKPGFEHDFLICLLHTAARISEIRVLAWEDVDLGRRIVTLWTSKRRGGNMEARKIAMSTTLHEVLSRLWAARFRDERYVFNDPNTGTAYTRTSNRIKYLMRDLCLRAGVTHFGAHSLRHFLATGFHDPYKAQKVLGHQNLKTTEIYLHDLGVDREAAAVFEDITNRITNEKNLSPEVVVHKGKNDPENDHVINSTNGITNEITNGANSTNEKRGYFLQ